MRCLECGAEIAERAQVCARCGSWAPVDYQLSVAADWAADAVSDAAGGLAPAAVHAGAGQQRPESAPDPDGDGAELAEWIPTPKFSTTRLRPGYDIDEVDAFIDDIRGSCLGVRDPSLTAEEIRGKQFSTTRLRPGYDEEEVDAFLDEAESRLAARVSVRCGAPAAGPGSGTADPAAQAAGIRCLECGAESAAGVQVCARCGAPVARQVPVSADQAEEESGDPITTLPGESMRQAAGQRPGPGSRRNARTMAGLGVALVVALTVLVASVTVISTRSVPSRPSASSRPSALSARQVTEDQLRTGDCLQGSDLNLQNYWWPGPDAVQWWSGDVVARVPCAQMHAAEVFFAGNAWPQSLACPGADAIAREANTFCSTAFAVYDGDDVEIQDSIFMTISYVPSGGNDWAAGDRRLVCVAFSPNDQGTALAPMVGSFKGTGQ